MSLSIDESITNLEKAERFLANIFQGEVSQALDLCAEEVAFTIFRLQSDKQIPIYGKHVGKKAGLVLFNNLSQLFDFGEFEVEATVKEGEHIVKFGRLSHTVKQTGKVFESLWVLIIRLNTRGEIVLYRMHEDTAALESAIASY